MLIHLVKKDCLLVKKYLPFMLLMAFAIPLFICSSMGTTLGSAAGFLAFFLGAAYTQFILYSSVSLAETKYPNGATLLCATPYTRSLVVKGKYSFNLALFAYCTTAYTITTFLFPTVMGSVDIEAIGVVFFLITCILGIIIPLEYKFGYEKTKYIYMTVMIASPYGLPSIMKLLQKNHIDLNIFPALPSMVQTIIPFVLAMVIGTISMMLSIRIYSEKEL